MSESTSIKMRDGLKDRLKAIAEAEERSVNWVMNNALEKYVEQRETRRAYLAEVDSRWREYSEAGLHVSAEEADAWIDGLLRGEDLAPPEPHK